jgi:hypothetical protein
LNPVPYNKNGLYVDGDVKDMQLIHTVNGPFLLALRNNDNTRAIKIIEAPNGRIMAQNNP